MTRDTTPTDRRAYERPEIGDDWAQAWDDLVEDLDSASLYVDSTDNTSETDPIPGTTHFEDVDAESVNTDDLNIDDTYHYASNDSDLDDALSSASDGDTIILGNAQFTEDRIIDKFLSIRGTGLFDNSGTRIDHGATWTFDERVKLERVYLREGEIIVDRSVCQIVNIVSRDQITIKDDLCTIVACDGGDVTFESGTDGGIVDACRGVSVTDNGENTVGDIA